MIGRHSLLINFNHVKNSLTLMSVTTKKFKDTVELPAIGVFVVNLSENFSLTCFPWKNPNYIFDESIKRLESLFNMSIKVEKVLYPNEEKSFNLACLDIKYFHVDTLDFQNFDEIMKSLFEKREIRERIEKLESLLNASVEARVKKQPSFCKICIELFLKGDKIECHHTKVGILFSGGLDSSILAAIANKFVHKDESIDLINVAFEKPKASPINKIQGEMYNVPDRKTGRQSYCELQSICPKRNWNFIEVTFLLILLINFSQQSIRCDNFF